ncbi:MAG: DUF4339 domain-containing protein [Polyangiales bacterium]
MHFVCRTCSAVQSVVPERASICASCGTRLLSHEPTLSEHAWYTHGDKGQAGPFDASQLARQFDRGELTWTDEVWRDGLRDWRAARKDDALVVAVASARGLDTETTRLDSVSRLLNSHDESGEQPLIPHEDTLVEAIPAGLASSWPVRPRRPGLPRRSRTQSAAQVLKLATMALIAFVGGGLLVGLMGRVSSMLRPSAVSSAPAEPAPGLASSSLITTAPVTITRPSSGELVKRTLPAFDEVRAELHRLESSVHRCVREPRHGVEVELTIVGESGRPRAIGVHAPRLTPGMIECARSALQDLQVAPFTAEALTYEHHYAW